MPQYVHYVAKRSIAAGHAVDSDYSLDLQVIRKDRGARVHRTQHETLNGDVYTSQFAHWVEWQIETAPLNSTDLALFREFIDSVMDGQVFTFDPSNWSATGGDERSVVLIPDSYRETRAVRRGGTQTNDMMRISFAMREVP